MASSSQNVRDILQFSSSGDLQRINAPLSTTRTPGWTWNANGSNGEEDISEEAAIKKAEEESRRENLKYVQEHLEMERLQIQKLNLTATEGRGRGASRSYSRGRGKDHFRGRGGRGRGRGGGRGRPSQDQNNRNHSPGEDTYSIHSEAETTLDFSGQSIFGTIPDDRDVRNDILIKYDFSQRSTNFRDLVIYQQRQEIIEGLKNHQVVMIEGFTGCGKTTQVPQYILDDAFENQSEFRIAVTQPRRIAAISVANRVAQERKWKVGGIIGYRVGMSKSISEDTCLSYMTTGVLLQLLIGRKSLQEWTHIIIDEVHERDLETDLLLLVIKKIMVDTYDTKTRIILMSATLNADKFRKYFPRWENAGLKKEPINIKVDSPTLFPIEEFYLEHAAKAHGMEGVTMQGLEEPKLHPECYDIALNIIENFDAAELKARQPRGAVLVFLPGLLEIETLHKLLQDVSNKKALEHQLINWYPLPLHSSITNEEQQKVFEPAKNGWRKIIMATNIAESSITVPDIKYVIDFCLTKNLSCDPATNYTCLRLDWASKNQCIQRRGRCGRVSAGTVYRMVTKKFYDTLEQEASPEMKRSSLESVVLQVKLLNMGPPKAVLATAVDPPEIHKIQKAVANLKEIGALTLLMENDKYDVYDGSLTFVGSVICHLPIDIRLGRLILLGHAFDCLDEAVVIAAGLSVKSPFSYPYSKRMEAFLAKQSWAENSFSDCLALLNVYQRWTKMIEDRVDYAEERGWARQHFVQLTSLREMRVLILELYKRLRHKGIEQMPQNTGRPEEDHLLILKMVIAGAFYPNYFSRARPNAKDYLKEITKDLCGSDPFNSVVFQGFPIEQPGGLYSKQISKIVATGSCIPKISYSGSRAIVTFDSRAGDFIGPISSAVYRSVKLRQLRIYVSFCTLSREDAITLYAAEQRDMETLVIRRVPDQVAMPGLMTQSIEAEVTCFESPDEFYIILAKDANEAQRISSELYKVHHSLTPLHSNACHPGQMCIALIEGERHERGRIDAVDGFGNLFVYALDKGWSRWIDKTHVFSMNDQVVCLNLHLPPALAIRCRLSEIKPAVRLNCIWTKEARKVSKRYISSSSAPLILEIYSVVDGVIAAELKKSKDPGCTSLNEILIAKKFADKASEPKKSFDNHGVREYIMGGHNGEALMSVPDHLKETENQQSKRYEPEMYCNPPTEDSSSEIQSLATLRGPSSPLEMNFNSMCNTAHYKQTIIDGSSLNSVALDQDPLNSVSRMMVAASVSVAHRTGHILARETTLMPPVPGICGLLAMIFCPKLEFRVDENNTKYTGCITGLGVDPSGSLIYKDHDMEIVFDTAIDEDDVETVNHIRSAMNSILSENTSTRVIGNLREDMKRRLLALLDKKRDDVDEVWPEEMYSWQTIDERNLSKSNESARAISAVFPLHRKVKLGASDAGPRQARNVFSASKDTN